MTADSSSFAEVLANLRRGDNQAAARVFDQFAVRLLVLARRHLDDRLRPKVDPEDIVQSVFQTVFKHLAEGQFDLGGWEGLWGLLTCITVRKCGKWADYFTTQGRDVGREVPVKAGDSSEVAAVEIFDREPTPAEAVALADTLEQSLRGLKDQEREIVALRLQNETVPEISRRLQCSESKVNRILRHVRERLESLRDAEDGTTEARPRTNV
jgi:RNA polymerase sigma-70 factor (ECF subfamily)